MLIAINNIKDPGAVGAETLEFICQLADSIESNGLLHPITVRAVNGLFEIVAGKRRFLACKRLGWTEIEATLLEGSDYKVAQIHENLKRHNLPWHEQIELTAELHKLRQEQHGTAKSGPGKDGWSMRDTAKELGAALGKVSEDALLLAAVQADPTLRNIKDKKTALKMVRAAAARDTQEEESGVSELQAAHLNSIHCGDSNQILKKFPDSSFEACITDPPWLKYQTDSPLLVADETTHLVFAEVHRVLKFNSFLYVFCGWADLLMYQPYLRKLGFTVQDMPLIWHKTGVFPRGSRQWSYNRDYEFILLAVKGNPALSDYVTPTSVMTFPSVTSGAGATSIHPNQKPQSLIEVLVRQCTFPDAVILDPFAGSGVLGTAAKTTGRYYVLIEKDPDFHNAIVERLYDIS